MGRIYVRLGRCDEAETCFARAGGIGAAPWDARSIDPGIRADALRQLAIERRRRHRYEEAAEAWRHLLEAGRRAPPSRRRRAAPWPSTTSIGRAISRRRAGRPSRPSRPKGITRRPTRFAIGSPASTASSVGDRIHG